MDGEHSDLAKQINGAKSTYVIKSGGDRSNYAFVHPCQMPPVGGATCKNAAGASPSSSRLRTVDPCFTTNSVRAPSYVGGGLAIQSSWLLTRHLAWIRRSIILPAAVEIAALSGATSTTISDVDTCVATYIGRETLRVLARLHRAFLGDQMFWLLPIVIIFIWRCRNQHQSNSDLSQQTLLYVNAALMINPAWNSSDGASHPPD